MGISYLPDTRPLSFRSGGIFYEIFDKDGIADVWKINKTDVIMALHAG